MCNSTIWTGVQVLGGAISASQQQQAGESSASYYEYLAKTSKQEAVMVEKTGERQVTATQDEAARVTQNLMNNTAGLEGTQKAALAGSGIGLGSATAEDIATDTFNKSKLDELAIRWNADMASTEISEQAKYKAWGLRRQAKGYLMAADNARQTGNMNMWSSILNSASSVASTWSRWQDTSQGSSSKGGK